jgi:DinB family protein
MIAEDLSYPIGRFVPEPTSAHVRRRAIAEIGALPGHLSTAVLGLNETQLDTPYRPGGWTVRQVVHHVADSHMNAFVRLKMALTEERPTVSAYDEKKFAALADAQLPVAISLELTRSLHARWLAIYGSMTETDWQRTFAHPEYPDPLTVDWQAQMYGWHSRHHVAHITALRRRQGW